MRISVYVALPAFAGFARAGHSDPDAQTPAGSSARSAVTDHRPSAGAGRSGLVAQFPAPLSGR